MQKVIQLLKQEFESSSGLTPQFAQFYKVFKQEFTKELESIGATSITFNRGHFYVYGFYTIGEQPWYFNLGDVRWRVMGNQLMYRKVRNYRDFTGMGNQYVYIEPGMANMMHNGK